MAAVLERQTARIETASCKEVTADGGHFGMPNCNKPKRLHARNIMIKSWYHSIEIFFVSLSAIFLLTETIYLDWSIFI